MASSALSRRLPARLLGIAVPLLAALGCAHRARAATAASPVDTVAASARPDTVPLATRGALPDSLAEYVGFYRWSFEHSEFVACGTASNDRPWWVVPTVVALQQRDSLVARVAPNEQGPVFVRVRGVAGSRMTMGAGHMGGSARYFRLFEVLDMRKADGAACPVRS